MARKTIRMEVNFAGKWVRNASLCMAASLFLRAVYYLGITNFLDIGFFEIVFCALLPLILSGAFVIMLSGLRRNTPQLYSLMGAVFCVFAIIASFYTGNVFRIIGAIVWYSIAGGVIFLSANGRLENKSLSIAVFVIPIVIRLIVFDLGRLSVAQWILEAAGLFMLASLAMYPMILKRTRR